MSIALTYNGLDMSTEVHEWEARLVRRVAGQDVDNRHGQYVAGRAVLGTRSVVVRGAIKRSNETDLRSRLSAYEVALAYGDAAALYLYNDRYLNARCVSSRFTPSPGSPYHRRFEIEFYCDDPFWYDAAQTTDSKATPGTSYNWTHAYGGTYLIYPVLNLTAAADGGCTNPTFGNTTISRTIQYTGTVAAAQAMEVDCAKRWMKVNSVKVATFTGTFLWLLPGNNALTFACSGTGPASISVVYRKRYYSD